MEVKRRYVLRRTDGRYVNLRFEPVAGVLQAGRFHSLEDVEMFLHGHYAPSDPTMYYAQEIEVTYREVGDDE